MKMDGGRITPLKIMRYREASVLHTDAGGIPLKRIAKVRWFRCVAWAGSLRRRCPVQVENDSVRVRSSGRRCERLAAGPVPGHAQLDDRSKTGRKDDGIPWCRTPGRCLRLEARALASRVSEKDRHASRPGPLRVHSSTGTNKRGGKYPDRSGPTPERPNPGISVREYVGRVEELRP